MQRIFFDIFFFLCIAFLPWWLVLFVGAVGVFIFHSFYEILFAGIVIDSLYAPATEYRTGFLCVATLVAILIFIAIELLKRRLRF